jgi:hypothetical protein
MSLKRNSGRGILKPYYSIDKTEKHFSKRMVIMKKRVYSLTTTALMFVMMLGLCLISAPVSAKIVVDTSTFRPIIFVHGSGGSGAQFESQSMRFTSNGYPANLLFAFEYNTSSPDTEGSVARMARLDAFVDAVLASTGADKVYLMGHSRGTTESFVYLGNPAHAAKVAKYVNLDGSSGKTAIVPTLALWATRGWSYNPANQIVNATNVFIPNQTHVEVATSAQSFVEMYKFFTDNLPGTDQIVPEPPGQVRLTGRAMFYPQGTGVGEGTLEIWEVNGFTGARMSNMPKATYTLSGSGFADGAWGPFNAQGLKNYEFVILREGARPHHFYFQPFMRSNHFVRLLTSPAGGVGDLMERSMGSAALVITRNKEFWGDDAVSNDILTINGLNVINAATCPIIKGIYRTGVIGIFAYDKSLNGQTDVSVPIPTFFAVGFMTGVDIYVPAADPPNGTISLVLTPRGGGKTQVINIMNWASSNHSVSIPFNDFSQYVIAFPSGRN